MSHKDLKKYYEQQLQKKTAAARLVERAALAEPKMVADAVEHLLPMLEEHLAFASREDGWIEKRPNGDIEIAANFGSRAVRCHVKVLVDGNRTVACVDGATYGVTSEAEKISDAVDATLRKMIDSLV